MNKLLLIDGSYYVYRSFHAHPMLTNHRGEPTGAIYGFVKAIWRMIRHIQPTHAAVVWDGHPKRRMELQPSYKEGRDSRPEEITPQFQFLEKLVPMMGLHGVRSADHEADDLIAAYSMETERLGIYSAAVMHYTWETIIASADKDILQCVNQSTSIYSTSKADRGENEFALIGPDEVRAKWGVSPEQFGDVLALMGDDSDNIQGIKGVGPKTAAKWINRHKTLVRALNCECQPADADMVLRNREMIRLDCDIPLPKPIEELACGMIGPEFEEAMRACDIILEKL